ncbi:hypothetical protein FO519_007201 [Halicephalobus sp. NKZ332]|nr:hypothetical protein FO519_007201 [Halicephalobus sp. NKZ332]
MSGVCLLPKAKQIHENISNWGWSVETEEDRKEAIERKFGRVKWLLRSTGLYNENFDDFGLASKIFFVLREIVVIGLCAYSAITILALLVLDDVYDEKTPQEFLMCDWAWQSLFSIIFLVYWQHRGYIKQLFETVHWPTTSRQHASTRRVINLTLLFCFFIVIFMFFWVFVYIFLWFTNRLDDVRVDVERFSLLGHPIIYMFFGSYLFYIYNALLTFYIIVSVVVYHELKNFNEDLMELGKDKTKEMEEEILKMYIRHTKLTDIVRSVDNFFEVYTFVLIGLNIPLSVFTLLNTLASTKSLLDFSVNLPALGFCFLELAGLTVVPAKLHAEIHRVEGLIYGNAHIWHPYNEKVYLVAGTFVSHIKQSNLGISLMLRQMAQLHAERILMIALGNPFETPEEQKKAISIKFTWTLRLLKSTLIYYGVKKPGVKNGIIYYFRVLLAYFFVITGLYNFGFQVSNLIKRWGSESYVSQVVMLSWSAQCILSMIFLLYWQYCGYIAEILKRVHIPNMSKEYTKTRRSIHRTMIFSLGVFLFAIIFFLIISVVHHYQLGDVSVFNLSDFNFFGSPKLLPLFMILSIHSFFVWNICITFYIIISSVILFELTEFNKSLREVGSDTKGSEELGDQLLSLFVAHIDLAKMVRSVDNAFEVYSFVMVGANIPTMIFSLLMVLKAVSKSWVVVTLALPGVFFTVIELIGLTAVPAKLHDAIRKVESIVYSNTDIWCPYNERVYTIASAFVAHVKQTNLGISLWGFAIVSKPLILTMNIDGSSAGYSTHIARCVNIELTSESNNNSSNNAVLTEVTVKEGPEVNEFPLNIELYKVKKLLIFFRCAFFVGIPRATIIINQIIWLVIMVIQSAGAISMAYMTSFAKLDNKTLVFTLSRSFQVIQFIITMIAMLYWQKTGRFKNYTTLLHAAQQSAGCIKYKKHLSRIICYLYGVVAIMIGFFAMFELIVIFEIDVDIFNQQVIKLFRTYKVLIILHFITVVYSSICTSVCMFLYCIFTYGSVLEIRYFNERLGNIGKNGRDSMVNEMITLIGDHAKLSEAIRNLDSMCEIFVFVMIASTIPITVFTVLQLLSTKGLPLINLLITLPMLFFCVALLTALTAIPAALHKELDRSKHYLYINTNVWEVCNKEIFHVANSLVGHLSQPDLGISVWGFAIVSKPLILTTISVMVTCMAFLLELRKQPQI